MNVKKMVMRQHDNIADALEQHIDSGHFGSVGLVLFRDLFIIWERAQANHRRGNSLRGKW
jgi:hypothetical protein